nr:Chain E, PRO-PHE-ALA-THR-CYS-ASP-SER [Escherichia coli]4TKY_F Chain F, PRO-PHE-ALA-THR-CYS-ASP-SER [Escherichia coli]4TKY_G Chain G, PRO-PHE-ALA-THR-CYS-ASP-SER [Escherichia coli]4TKY_H Chain H, PRO-PHE-ALA-THR-CYS-ASP-SER [Escherichia coli]
PFATCDS